MHALWACKKFLSPFPWVCVIFLLKKPWEVKKIKKAILFSLALVGSALSANVFMGPEYAKELCEVWNKTPGLTEELGKSESWTTVPERKLV